MADTQRKIITAGGAAAGALALSYKLRGGGGGGGGKRGLSKPPSVPEWSDPEDPRRRISLDQLLRTTVIWGGEASSASPFHHPKLARVTSLGEGDLPLTPRNRFYA